MKVSPKQASFIAHSDSFINLADGAVRSGKTIGNFHALAQHCIQGPAGDMLILGKTERTVKRNVVRPLQDLWPGAVKYNQGSGELHLFGRRLDIVGANDSEAYTKVQGSTIAGAYCNELSLYPESMLSTIVDRCSVAGAKIFGDCNPQGPFHWLYKDFLAAGLPKSDLKRWRFTLDDNPALSEEYKARIKRIHTGVWYRRMVLGEWVMAEGVIYDMFSPDGPMVVDVLPADFDRVVVGVDYGTANATVFLLLGLHRGTWYVADEYRHDSRKSGRQKTDEEYASDFVRWLGDAGVRRADSVQVDPSAASFKLSLRRAGVSGVRDADNDVLDGIREVAAALNSGRLLISRRCSGLIEEMATYAWDPKAQERGEDKPLKQSDHGPDALRYAASRIFRTGGGASSSRDLGSVSSGFGEF